MAAAPGGLQHQIVHRGLTRFQLQLKLLQLLISLQIAKRGVHPIAPFHRSIQQRFLDCT